MVKSLILKATAKPTRAEFARCTGEVFLME